MPHKTIINIFSKKKKRKPISKPKAIIDYREKNSLVGSELISLGLEIEFREAVDRINAYTEPFPADVLLKLYAYYKKATNDYGRPSSKKPIINAFKTNALFQSEDITEDEAKQKYIDLANNYFLYRK